jgi:hypothetical protein
VLGSPRPPKIGGNPLNAYLSWPGYNDALTTDAALAKILTTTLDYMAATGSKKPHLELKTRLPGGAATARCSIQSRKSERKTTTRPMPPVLGHPDAQHGEYPYEWNRWRPAGPNDHGNGPMEGLGGIGIVDELLLQSHTGTITLFPQVPPGEPASFCSLRARGGFLVSAAMPTGQRDKIVSEVGGTATLRTPWS